MFSLDGNGHKDREYLDWILTDKQQDDYTTDIFGDLMYQQFLQYSTNKSNALTGAVLGTRYNLVDSRDSYTET